MARFQITSLLLSLWMASVASVELYQDKHDDCKSMVSECKQSETLWSECPISCAADSAEQGFLSKIQEVELFYDMSATKFDGKELPMDDMEGYMFIYAFVPLAPGMAQYYYEMLETVQKTHKYHVQTVILPYKNDNDPPANTVGSMKVKKDSKTIILKKTNLLKPPEILEYLMKVTASSDTEAVLDTKSVTVFVLSNEGRLIQKLISPTFKHIEKVITQFRSEDKVEELLNKALYDELKRRKEAEMAANTLDGSNEDDEF